MNKNIILSFLRREDENVKRLLIEFVNLIKNPEKDKGRT